MSQLNEIVGAILTEIAEAQHQSNLYSIFLSKKYEEKEHGLADLAIPNAIIKEVEFELRYGINGSQSETLDTGINLDELKEVLLDYAKKSIAITVKNMQSFFSEEIQRKNDDDSLDSNSDADIQKINTIKKNIDSPNFFNYAVQYLYNALWESKDTLLKEQTKLSRKAIFKVVIEATEKIFLDHPDLQFLTGTDKAEREKIQTACEKEIKDFFSNQDMPSFNVDKQHDKNSIDVIVETSLLEKLPPGIINTIKIKAEIKNFKLEIDKGPDDDDHHSQHNTHTNHLIPSHY